MIFKVTALITNHSVGSEFYRDLSTPDIKPFIAGSREGPGILEEKPGELRYEESLGGAKGSGYLPVNVSVF